jgi:hypothetical protein
MRKGFSARPLWVEASKFIFFKADSMGVVVRVFWRTDSFLSSSTTDWPGLIYLYVILV